MAMIIIGVITLIGWFFLFYGFYKFFQAVYRRLTIKAGDIFYKERYSSKNPFICQTCVDYYEIKQIKKGWLEYESSHILYRNNGENVDFLNFNDENRTIGTNGYMNIFSFTLLMIVDYKKLKRSNKNEKERRNH
jgi:hypothetical protein